VSHGQIKVRAKPYRRRRAIFRATRGERAVAANVNNKESCMIEDVRGNIDYDESGAGPTLVMVPGSCSTGAAWRPAIASLNGRFRCVTTSLPGYGGTAERRPAGDASIAHLAEVVESVVRTAGEPVHLVGHSFGGLVSLAVALRKRVRLASIAIARAARHRAVVGKRRGRTLPRVRTDE
jgi:pimeloyl-ACP methyl ester carboxylesterase